MIDFLFVQKSPFPSFGPMFISAVLKKNGYNCDLILASEEKDLIKTILDKKPLIVSFPTITGEHKWILETAREIKKKSKGRILTLLGGPHPTYYPEIIKEKGVDIISLGESEDAILELICALKNKKDIKKIMNLWIKENDKIYKNEIRPLVYDLDNLPFPDREIYYKYDFLKKASVKQFLTGRGCPYSCTFCANNLLRKIYQGKGRYIRRRSPDNVISEMKDVRKKYGMKTLSFTDDNFISNQVWLDEFLPKYKKEINLPFMCNVTANLVTESLIKKLKSAGCYGVSMGIESGNEKLRKEILGKYITNSQILSAGKTIKKYKLILKTYNILCLPGETVESAFETILLNAAIRPDHTSCSLLQPYPKYDITEFAKKNNYLPRNFDVDDVFDSIYSDSPINVSNKNQIKNLQTFFFIAVKYPKLIPLIRMLIKLPPNFVYKWLAKLFYGFYMSRVHKLTLLDIVRYAIHCDPFKI
ncbi:MAG: radical SAM protein [Candidatus Aenigmarchaeota archaeon]|nr:radical SAM protein [Candidatus Aenigmarchaeota archaeon]